MRRFALLLLVGLMIVTLGALALGATPSDDERTPLQRIAILKGQLARSKQATRVAREQRDDARAETAAANLVIEDLQAENARLRNRVPLDQILALDADARWAAMIELWRATPTIGSATQCGYDRAQNDLPLTYTSFSFYRWTLAC